MKRLFILTFCVLFLSTSLGFASELPVINGDVDFVLQIAAGEPDVGLHDKVLLRGSKYIRSFADLSTVVEATRLSGGRALIANRRFAHIRCTHQLLEIAAKIDNIRSSNGKMRMELKDRFLLRGVRSGLVLGERELNSVIAATETAEYRGKIESYWQQSQKCTLCNGTGTGVMGRTCPGCHGAGWTGPMKSATSKISEKCPLCDGTGKDLLGRMCPGCHGAGWTGPMKSATSKISEKCTLCDGTGKDLLGHMCPGCHGAGWTGPMKKSTQFPGMCTFCSGTGVGAMGRTCFVCHGSGMTGPMKKSATVSVKCPLCEGAGTTVLGKTCPGCHGAGYTGPMKSAPLVQHDANCPHCTTPSGTAVNPAGAVFVDSYLKKVLKSRMVLRGDQDAAELLKQMK